ncbi:ubiquinone-dependent pyruvate dehydrogenase [Chitinophaga pinensis]|uniref:Thiamine pyrophosphate protein domain protein TPP-binding n=1 Tax=Chitinophaga pinensis (strain ATCC 43595 / DSM 2588 / LMG 13176 / NBRC 15968 / NCIMB 11800 / UQM 2034) TaxID=485918 RepID=A0A979G3C2_CHIPD|nr:ubiquinone-dependent pyruvate dehydrogenase [Chitinophaga pinensis]ACU59918.1 thiamine pyrophosphate protein domain protein TPP-binding [Chitinophaga pinensis DSM 2588]
MPKTIAAQIVEQLIAAGVKRVHGVVGDSLNSITDEIRQHKELEWIHYRHEEAAAFAAGAEAQLTGQLAVCAGSCGPGNMHLINGLYDAHRSMAPVLAIAAQIPSTEIGTSYFQETRPEALFRECSHYCETIASARQMPRVLQTAMQHAIGLGGVAVIALSGDVATQTVDDNGLEHSLLVSRPAIRPSDTELHKLADLINAAEKVTLLCGRGCAGAHDELIALGEKILSPMVHALRGKEFVEYDNPFDVGMTGLIGFSSGYHAMERSDLVIMLGTDFPYKDWFPSKAKIVQVDIRAERLGRRCAISLGLVGDVKETLYCLLPLLKQKTDRAFLDKCITHYHNSRQSLESHATGKADATPIHPEYLTHILNELADPDAIFTADVGEPTVWAARYLRMKKGQRLLGSFNHGSMASAMPQAIGAQLTHPGRQVISLSGDGGFSMLMGDILTIVQYNLPVKIVVFNNSSLGFVAMEMKVAGLPPYGTDLKNPDFARMAEAIGIKGIRVENPANVRTALQKAFEHDGPVLIDAVVNPSVLVMPPKIEFSQAKGFGMYALKQVFNGNGKEVWDTLTSNFLD